MTTLENIKARALATPLPWPEAERLRILAWFEAHPDVTHAYLFYNGTLRSEQAETAAMFSRTAQLVSIALEGVPVMVSRWSVTNRKGT